jgi:1,4-alpha-glucan branching enzyme
LIALRLNKHGNTAGLTGNHTSILSVTNDNQDKVAVFLRSTPSGSGDVLVILNMYSTAYNNFALKNVPKDGIWNVRFNGDLKKYSSLYDDFGSGQTQIKISGGAGTIQVPKYSLLILSQ